MNLVELLSKNNRYIVIKKNIKWYILFVRSTIAPRLKFKDLRVSECQF